MLTSIHLPLRPASMAGGALSEPGLVTGWFMGCGVGVGAPDEEGLLILSPARISSVCPAWIELASFKLLRATMASTVVLYLAAMEYSWSPLWTTYCTAWPVPATGTTFGSLGAGAGAVTRVGVALAPGGAGAGVGVWPGGGALLAGAALPGMVSVVPATSRFGLLMPLALASAACE